MDGEQDEARARAFTHWQSLMTNWHRRAKRNRRMSKSLMYSCVILPIGTTALAGVPEVPRWWIVVASAGAALAAGLMAATRSYAQWPLAREIQTRLLGERFLYEQGAGVYEELSEVERTRLFSVRIVEIGAAGHSSWAGHVSDAATDVLTIERPAASSS